MLPMLELLIVHCLVPLLHLVNVIIGVNKAMNQVNDFFINYIFIFLAEVTSLGEKANTEDASVKAIAGSQYNCDNKVILNFNF